MSTTFGKFKIYPRGFLGAPLEPVLERKPRTQGRIQYDVSIFDPEQERKVLANLKVEAAYQAVARNELNARKFSFKEHALQEFMWAFGTSNFGEWVAAQYSSPSFGSQHQDFLVDTLHFLNHGTRRCAIQNWRDILDEDEQKSGTRVVPEEILSFFGARSLSECKNARYNNDIWEIVQMWMRHSGGWQDLVITGHILFGINE